MHGSQKLHMRERSSRRIGRTAEHALMSRPSGQSVNTGTAQAVRRVQISDVNAYLVAELEAVCSFAILVDLS
jgi:hypothetical protein